MFFHQTQIILFFISLWHITWSLGGTLPQLVCESHPPFQREEGSQHVT